MPSWADLGRLQDELRERLLTAEIAHRNAKQEHERLIALVKDLGANHPDGALALKRAVQDGREALDNYKEALRIFTDLTLFKILPPQNEQPE
jgi:hypothetical protein